jgi:hypothetical protein
MTERISVPPPIPSTAPKPKRKWRWLKIAATIIMAGLLALRILLSYSPIDLELVRRDLFDAARDGRVLELTNAGNKPVVLVGMTINDRTDCRISRLSFVDNSPLFPSTLKIGDQVSFVSSCQVIRVTVDTDQGSQTYSFNR